MSETVVTSLRSIPAGEGRNFHIAGRRLAIFHTRSGRVFTTQAECPHKGGPLADGLVGGETLICPLHSWKFDLDSGQPVMGECPLRIYPTRLDEAGRILVNLG